MSTALFNEMANGKMCVIPLTLDQYHRMIKEGILEEGAPIELLDGFLVRKDRSQTGADLMTVGHEHIWVINRLTSLLVPLACPAFHAQFQHPIAIPPDSEPEPDAAILVGTLERYRDRLPGPSDVLCVFEVADSSLRHDRITKQRIYADAGISQYVIVNLADRVVEYYEQPASGTGRYGTSTVLRRGEKLGIRLAEDRRIEIEVEKLLP